MSEPKPKKQRAEGPPRPLKVLSFCSGAGGLDLGLSRAGLGQIVFRCESWARARTTLRENFGDGVPIPPNLLELSSDELKTQAGVEAGDEMVFVGGVPQIRRMPPFDHCR